MSIASLSAKLVRKARPATSRSAADGKTASGRALQKGQQTKMAIVEAALNLATQIGLEGLSIGALAEATQMSKSGVFAHFGSREELQISVIHQYFAQFEQAVFYAAMEQPRGLPRVQALFANWMKLVAEESKTRWRYCSRTSISR
jgi:AcrR family transcriptional regulator